MFFQPLKIAGIIATKERTKTIKQAIDAYDHMLYLGKPTVLLCRKKEKQSVNDCNKSKYPKRNQKSQHSSPAGAGIPKAQACEPGEFCGVSFCPLVQISAVVQKDHIMDGHSVKDDCNHASKKEAKTGKENGAPGG